MESSFEDIAMLSMTYMFDQCTLMFEGVTLAEMIKFMVEMFIDLARGTVLDEKAAENSETAHPHDLAVKRQSAYNISTDTPLAPFFSLSGEHNITYLGILASAVPFLLPKPRCLPIRLAAVNSRALDRECMVTGLRMMRPSETSLRMV